MIKKTKKVFFILIYFAFITINLSAQMSKTGQRIKQIKKLMQQKSGNNKKTNKRAKNKQKSKKAKLYTYNVSLKLAGGSNVSGKIKVALKQIIVKNEKRGVVFKKVLLVSKVKSIKVLKYKSRIAAERNKYKAYYFIPSLYQITYHNGEKYYYKNGISALYKFDIKTDYGHAELKSYFLDYWVKKQKSWYYLKSKQKSFPLTNAREKTVTKFFFTK